MKNDYNLKNIIRSKWILNLKLKNEKIIKDYLIKVVKKKKSKK